MNHKLTYILSFLLLFNNLKSQEDASYAMYIFNGLYYNPAYTGSRGGLSGVALYRHQFSGIENGPRSFNAAIHAPLKNNRLALGLQINNDRLGQLILNNAFATFAYRIPLNNIGKNSTLAFGIQAGVKHFNYNFQEINNSLPISDPVFQQNFTSLSPNFGFGIQVSGDYYIAGISAPNLLYSSVKNRSGVNETETYFDITEIPVFLNLGYVIKLNETFRIKTSLLAKHYRALPFDMDMNLGLHVKKYFYIGALYRLDNSGGAILAIDLSSTFRVGYAFEMSSKNSLKGLNKGSHEFMLGFDIASKNKNASNCKCRVINPRDFRYF